MPHSHTCLKYHLVFSTKHRLGWITADIERALYEYIGGIIRKKSGQLIEIGGIEDHVHILAGFHQSRTVAGMAGAIKSNSSRFGKEFTENPDFSWQEGYSAFTVSESQIPRVKRYLQRQKEHHHTMSYEDEVRLLCRRHGIEFDEAFFKDTPSLEEPSDLSESEVRSPEGGRCRPGCQPWDLGRGWARGR